VFVVFHKNETPKNETILSITHDGKFLGSLKGDKIDLPVIKILKASYGDPRVFDVREKLQKMIDAGKTEFVVSEMAKPVDPAFGVLKTLEIEYEADGKTQTWKGDDHAKVSLKFPAMKILKAKYGPPTDGPGMIDVREKLQKLFDAGKTYFPVTDLANPIDPAFKVVKTLEIQYEVEGKTHIWSGQDGAFVNPEQFQTITAEPSIAKNGKPAIDVWQSGNYEVKLASNKTWKANVTLPKPSDISENWQASFPKKEVAFDKLISWSDSNDDYVKYFSGTAVYRKSFNVPKDFLTSDQRVYLDLGKVNTIAELKINKKDFGILWTLTKVIDITDALKADGNNQIEIRVTNLWPNRLIGDAHLPDDAERNPNGTLTQWPAWLLQGHPIPNGRETFCMWNLWKKDDALQPSGLIGPVRLLPVKKFVVE
jgi:hypothetical protein